MGVFFAISQSSNRKTNIDLGHYSQPKVFFGIGPKPKQDNSLLLESMSGLPYQAITILVNRTAIYTPAGLCTDTNGVGIQRKQNSVLSTIFQKLRKW